MISELPFESYLTYSPSKRWPFGPPDDVLRAEEWMKSIKNGSHTTLRGKSPYDFIAERMRIFFGGGAPEGSLFFQKPTLIPVPRSGLPPPEPYHWPAREMARSLVKHGFGTEMSGFLVRTTALKKAALGGERNAFLQRDALGVTEQFPPKGPMLLVDDIVTSGSALLGAALRVLASFPGAVVIGGFAAMRTMSDPSQFTRIRDPASGSLTMNPDGSCVRRP
jgi:hypothetical protein